jgi:hypothetical protein
MFGKRLYRSSPLREFDDTVHGTSLIRMMGIVSARSRSYARCATYQETNTRQQQRPEEYPPVFAPLEIDIHGMIVTLLAVLRLLERHRRGPLPRCVEATVIQTTSAIGTKLGPSYTHTRKPKEMSSTVYKPNETPCSMRPTSEIYGCIVPSEICT